MEQEDESVSITNSVRKTEQGSCICVGTEEGIVSAEERCEKLEFEVRKVKSECEGLKLKVKEFRELEERCMSLEKEVEKRASDFDVLEQKIKAYEVENLGFENELEVLRRSKAELEKQLACVERDNGGRGKGVIGVVDEEDESDQVMQLMIENKVLEVEKKKAESDVEFWKKRFMDLESVVLNAKGNLGGYSQLIDGKVEFEPVLGDRESPDISMSREKSSMSTPKHVQIVGTMDRVELGISVSSPQFSRNDANNMPAAAGTPFYVTPYKNTGCNDRKRQRGDCVDSHLKSHSRVRKHLNFVEASPTKKIAPCTPSSFKPSSNIIDLSDSDEELCVTRAEEKTRIKLINVDGHNTSDTAFARTSCNGREIISTNNSKTLSKQNNDEADNNLGGDISRISNSKRKQTCNIIASDTDSDEDDKIPICKLLKKCRQEPIADENFPGMQGFSVGASGSGSNGAMGTALPRRRRLATSRQIEGEGGSPMKVGLEDGESEELESDSEDESLDGFIDYGSSESVSGDASTGSIDESDTSESDEDITFKNILSQLRRKKDHKSEWKFEGDMLADLGKDPELCMKAVCALYRQQTSEEKACKGTLYYNGRGFSKFDALRGCALAEFLLDGDPESDVRKSLTELKQYPKGLELCKKLATHYSKQLFEIYNNKEDPFFSPS